MIATGQTMRAMCLFLLIGAGLSFANASTDRPARLDRFFESVNTLKAGQLTKLLSFVVVTARHDAAGQQPDAVPMAELVEIPFHPGFVGHRRLDMTESLAKGSAVDR